MIECDYCYVEFEVQLNESEEVRFCPCCGEKLDTSLNFND